MSASQERGRDRLENWGLWSRLDGAPCDMKRQVSWYTPPVAGDVWDGMEVLEQPDTRDAELVERMVVGLGFLRQRAVKLRYVERYRIERVARAVRESRDMVEKLLLEVEQMVGRG